jgi:hypothetical protein
MALDVSRTGDPWRRVSAKPLSSVRMRTIFGLASYATAAQPKGERAGGAGG